MSANDADLGAHMGTSKDEICQSLGKGMNLNDARAHFRRQSGHGMSVDSPMDTRRLERDAFSQDEARQARDLTPDIRLRIVEELLASEVVYYDRLRTVFHTYANPLSKWGLTGKDHDMLFAGLDELLNLVESFIRQLDQSVAHWDPQTARIGGIITSIGSFWTVYEHYCCSQRQLLRRLKEKEKNSAFKAFLDVRRDSSQSRLSLEALLALPVQRVPEYQRLLCHLFDTMEHDHPDFDHLSDAVAKANQLVQRRQEEAVFLENQIKLAQVQERFAQNLYLNLPLDCVDAEGRKKKSSLPSHRHGSHSGHGSSALRYRNGGVVRNNTSPGAVIRAWKGSPIRATVRTYVKEGAVQFTNGYSHQDRYLVLFSDLLLVAKSKSQSTFRLKQRLRLSEMWLAECIDEVSETSLKGELSFVLGWPTSNTVATFGSKEDRDTWHSLLSRYIGKQRDLVEPRSVSLKVYNRAGDTVNGPQFQIVNVDRNDTTQEVVTMALETLGVKDDSKGYQLWVISGKDESAYPLIGHEFPYAIKLSHLRQTLDSVENDQLRHISKHHQCQFILKKRKKTHTTQSSTPRRFLYKSIRKSPFVQWATRWRTGTPHGSQERLDCFQLFGSSLSKVVKDGQLPKSIMAILVRLYKDGPSVSGVFRRSCNARLAREMREALNSGEEVSIQGADILVLATIMKEFLRSLPDCIFCCDNYSDLVAANSGPEEADRIEGILRVIDRLPLCNYVVLRHFMWVLYRVAENSGHNSMDAHNIAVCVSPSLLWTAESMSTVRHEVPPLIEFMVTNCVRMFGNEVPSAFTAGKRLVRVRSESEGTNRFRIHHRPDNVQTPDSVSSTEMEYGESGDEGASPQSTLSKDSALTASDSNLYTEHEQFDCEKRGLMQTAGDATLGRRRSSVYSRNSSSEYGSHRKPSDTKDKRRMFLRSNSDDVRGSCESLDANGGSLPSSLPDDNSFFADDLPTSGSMPSLCGDEGTLDSRIVRKNSIPRTYSDIPTSPTKLKNHPMLQRRQTPPKIAPATRRLPGQPPGAPNLVERRERPGHSHSNTSGGWSRPLRQSRRSPVAQRRKYGLASKSAPASPESDRPLDGLQRNEALLPPSYDWAVEQNARAAPGSMSHYIQQSWQHEPLTEPQSLDIHHRSNSVFESSPSPASTLNSPLSSTSYKAAKSRFYVPASYTTVVTAEVSSEGRRNPNVTTVIHPIIHGEGSPSRPTKKRSMFYHRVSTSGPVSPPTRQPRRVRSVDADRHLEGKKQNYFYQPEDEVALEGMRCRSSTFSSVRAWSNDEALSSCVRSTDLSDFEVGRPRPRLQTAPSQRSATEPNTPVGSYRNESYLSSSSEGISPLLGSRRPTSGNQRLISQRSTSSTDSSPRSFKGNVRRIKSVDQLRERINSSGVDSSPLPDRRAVVSAFENRAAVNSKDSPSSRPLQLTTDISGRYVGVTQRSSTNPHRLGLRSKSIHNPLRITMSAPGRHLVPVRSRHLPLQRSFDSAMDDLSPDEEYTPDEERTDLFPGLEESYV